MPDQISLPEIRVPRGGITFADHRSDDEKANDSAYREFVHQMTARIMVTRDQTIEDACITALAHSWDIHIHEPEPSWTSRPSDTDLLPLMYIGIEFTPAAHLIPTIHRHQVSRWDDAEVWDNDAD